MSKNRKVGRPRKEYADGERPTIISLAVPEGLVRGIDQKDNLSREFSLFMQFKRGEKSGTEVELSHLQSQIKETETELSALRARAELIIERLKREDNERRAIIFERDAVTHYLVSIFKSIAKSNRYDESEVSTLRNDCGIDIQWTDFLKGVRHSDELKETPEFLSEFNVKMLPNCHSKRYFKSILEDWGRIKGNSEEK
jgi:hypothetical protein